MATHQQHLPPPNSARLAITSLCYVLRHYGISTVDPETVRQAKFDGPVAGDMWRILHDTTLVVLAGCSETKSSHAALSWQWEQLSLELACGDDCNGFPHEGAALVLHQLALWGAPLELLRELVPTTPTPTTGVRGSFGAAGGSSADGLASSWPPVRSRPLLLALGWLVAAAGLFERRVGQLEPGPELRALLPPYPQDSCTGPAVYAAYDRASQDAQEHVQRLPVGGGNTAATAATASTARNAPGVGGSGGVGFRGRVPSGDPFGPSPAALAAEGVWADVEAAAQRAVMLCGRVRSRLVALQAATDCRHRLAHSLWSRQSAASPSSRPLTPYELQLCAQPTVVQRHMTTLESATVALLEQQELAAHGALFFEWMGSVIAEEQQRRRAGPGGGRDRGRKSPAAQAGGGSGPLASLEHLPYVSSVAGAKLAAHLKTQLESAVQAAEPELEAARRRLAAVQGGSGTPAATPRATVTIQHFLALAEQAVSERSFEDADIADGGPSGLGLGGPSQSSGTASQQPLITLPGALHAADGTPSWQLPGDVTAALSAVQDASCRKRCTELEDAERFRKLRYAALLRYDFVNPGAGAPGGFGAAAGGPLASVLAAAAGGTAPGGPAVPAASETERLLGAVLAAARPLARTRAANKAALLGALQDLPEGYRVAGL